MLDSTVASQTTDAECVSASVPDESLEELRRTFFGFADDLLLGINVADREEVDPDSAIRHYLDEIYWPPFRERYPSMPAEQRRYLGHVATVLGCIARKVWETNGRPTPRPTVRDVEAARRLFPRLREGDLSALTTIGPDHQTDQNCPLCPG